MYTANFQKLIGLVTSRDFIIRTNDVELSIPFTNEFSEARWVFRFKIGLTKETHLALIDSINQAPVPAEPSTSETKKVFTQPVQSSQQNKAIQPLKEIQ